MELSGCRSWKRARDFLFHADLMTRSLWKARRPIGDERASRCAIECLKKESLRWKVSRNVFGRPRIPNDRAQSSPNLSRPRLLRAYPIQPARQSSASDNHDQHMDSSNFFCALLPKTNLGSTITSSYPALHLIDRFRRVYGRCYFLCRNTPARDTRAKQ